MSSTYRMVFELFFLLRDRRRRLEKGFFFLMNQRNIFGDQREGLVAESNSSFLRMYKTIF